MFIALARTVSPPWSLELLGASYAANLRVA
jgi:hypothetical protein